MAQRLVYGTATAGVSLTFEGSVAALKGGGSLQADPVTGRWSVLLDANADAAPGSFWSLIAVLPTGAGETLQSFTVPSGVGPLSIADCPPVDAGNPNASSQFATAGLPPWAQGSQNRYDPVRCLYNAQASSMRALRAGLGRAASGGLGQILVLGDSETDSYVGTGYAQTSMWPIQMRNVLTGLGIPSAGSGLIKLSGNSPTPDPRVTTTGNWARTWGGVYAYSADGTAGSTMTITTVDAPGTNVDILYSNAGVGFGYAVKNASGTVLTSGTITVNGTATFGRLALTGLTAATSVVLTTTTAGYTAPVAVNIYSTSGLLVHNLAQYGSKATGAAGWADTSQWFYYLPAAIASVPTPDAVVIPIGVNDLAAGAAPAAVTTAIAAIRAAWPNATPILIGQYQPSTVTLAAWQAYVAALYPLSDSLNCLLIDLLDRSGGFAVASANNLMGDGIHPNAAAQRDWGRAVALALAA